MDLCTLVSVQAVGCGFCELYNPVKLELQKELNNLVTFRKFERKNPKEILPKNIAEKIYGFPTVFLCPPGEFEKLKRGKSFEAIFYGCYKDESGKYGYKMIPYPGIKYEYSLMREWVLTNISNCYSIDLMNED